MLSLILTLKYYLLIATFQGRRLILYTKLSKLNNDDELIKFEKELKDKYGSLPVESIDLLKSVRLKWIAQS